MALLIALAFVSGLATAISPCVLPALPVVLAGSWGSGGRRLAGIAAGFIASFSAFTIALTAALRAIGLGPDVLRGIAIAALAAVGLTLLVPRLGAALSARLAPVATLGDRIPRRGTGLAGGLLVGVALGLVWTPCAGPIFAAVAALAATGDAGVDPALILVSYSAGAILPLLAVAHGGRRLARRLGGRTAAFLRPGLGVAMVAVAALIALGLDTRFSAAVIARVPSYTDTLQAFESSGAVRDRLARLSGRVGTPPLLAAARGSTPSAEDGLGLPDAGPAPELRGITATLNNGDRPLRLADLRGRVVLLDFWTYSCVNCLRELPHLRALDSRYRSQGLTVVGVETPEFLFEGETSNVRRAVRDLGIRYPVVIDPHYATWSAYGNLYWPTTYLIDRSGHVRDLHIGEGGYARTEQLVRRLLAVDPALARARAVPDRSPPAHAGRTPETYLGSARIRNVAPPQRIAEGRAYRYRAPRRLARDRIAFSGTWTVTPEAALTGPGAVLELRFRAAAVHLVLTGPRGGAVEGRVLLDGSAPPAGARGDDVGPGGRLRVGAPRLYNLLRFPTVRDGVVRIALPPGVAAYSFTFG